MSSIFISALTAGYLVWLQIHNNNLIKDEQNLEVVRSLIYDYKKCYQEFHMNNIKIKTCSVSEIEKYYLSHKWETEPKNDYKSIKIINNFTENFNNYLDELTVLAIKESFANNLKPEKEDIRLLNTISRKIDNLQQSYNEINKEYYDSLDFLDIGKNKLELANNKHIFNIDDMPTIKPLIGEYRITSSYDLNRSHPILKTYVSHSGIDFAARIGTPIIATNNGVIEHIGTKGPDGKIVIIKHGAFFSSIYKHMDSFKEGSKIGQEVKKGDIIGYVGNSGLTTGPHLHYEVRILGIGVNPELLFNLEI